MRKGHWTAARQHTTVRCGTGYRSNIQAGAVVRVGLLQLLVCIAAIAAVPCEGHHSFAAEFDGTKPVRLVGIITRIEWTNPHSYFYLDVKDSKGHISNWACETGNPGALSRRGWKKGDIKYGDPLIVDGYLAKDGSKFIDARRVTLPDGRVVYGGSPGDGGPGDSTAPGK
jgi:hypothetical protein